MDIEDFSVWYTLLDMKPEKTSLRGRPLDEGQENITNKSPKMRISLAHSRNKQEVKWCREGVKMNFQDAKRKSTK